MCKQGKPLERQDVPPDQQWDTRGLFENEEAFDAALLEAGELAGQGLGLQGSVSRSLDDALTCLAWEDRLLRRVERLSCYAWNLLIVDGTDRANHERVGRFEDVKSQADAAASFVDAELLELPEGRRVEMEADPRFDEYRPRLLSVQRRREHTLGLEAEKVLARLDPVISSREHMQQLLLNMDLRPVAIEGPDGATWTMDRRGYGRALRHEDRSFRARAQVAYYESIAAHEHTLSALLSTTYQSDAIVARARGFASALDATLFREGVPKEVIERLVASVDDLLEPYHRFVDLRRRRHGLDSLHGYDVRLPIAPIPKTDLPYSEGASVVVEAMRPLGSDYQDVLREALLGGWADWSPNRGKREACNACYDVHPYISVAYRGDLGSLSVLAHESGHALHQWLLARHNPFGAAEVGPFLAEIASKTQEFLLAEHMAEHGASPLHRAHAIAHLINLVANGFYWNSQLTDLELVLRQHVEEGAPLDAGRVREAYVGLSRRYLGPHATVDEEEGLEALVIPHMYLGFYNYTYATGTVAALELASSLRQGSDEAGERYLNLLQTGSDVPPCEALRRAGVDLSRPQPFETAARWLDERVSMLEALLERVDGEPSPSSKGGSGD